MGLYVSLTTRWPRGLAESGHACPKGRTPIRGLTYPLSHPHNPKRTLWGKDGSQHLRCFLISSLHISKTKPERETCNNKTEDGTERYFYMEKNLAGYGDEIETARSSLRKKDRVANTNTNDPTNTCAVCVSVNCCLVMERKGDLFLLCTFTSDFRVVSAVHFCTIGGGEAFINI